MTPDGGVRDPHPQPSERPGSLQSVLDAMVAGAGTVAELSRVTGLEPDLVRLALDRLVALGRISSDRSSLACPDAACSGCASPTGGGCSTGGLITLTLPPTH
jgi:hypothetical protein